MTDLKKGFEKNDISLVIKTIGDKRNNIMADPLIAQYLDELLRSVRLQALEAICKPYKSVKLEFLAK